MKFVRRGFSFVPVILSFTFVASAQEMSPPPAQPDNAATRLEPTRSTSKNTKFVSCFNKGQTTGSHIVRTPVFESPDGLHQAYIEVEAIAFQPKDELNYDGPVCENTSRLFIAGLKGDAFKLSYSQSPPDIADGNNLKLVDWSSDGTRLLMERTIWKYESERFYTDLVLYAVDSGTVTTPDLFKIFEARFGKDCSSENSAMGFLPGGNVVVAIRPPEDTYYNEGAIPCAKRRTLLALDAKSGLTEITGLLPSDFKPQRYGRFPELKTSKK